MGSWIHDGFLDSHREKETYLKAPNPRRPDKAGTNYISEGPGTPGGQTGRLVPDARSPLIDHGSQRNAAGVPKNTQLELQRWW